MTRSVSRTGRWALLGLCLSARPAVAADFKELVKRVPGEANVLVVCDLEKVLKSPIAAREGWAAKRADAYANQPMIVPPEATRLVMAGLLNLHELDALWEVSVIELSKPRPTETIARAERGFVETIADKPAAYSPQDAYFLELGPQTLGVVTPANRQFAARWAGQKNTLGGSFVSSYLWQTTLAMEAGTEFALAIDLEDAIGAPRIAERIRTDAWQSLEGKKYDLKALCELLASVKGVLLKIDVGEKISGKATIDFGQDVTLLGELGQPLVLELLDKAGASIPDFADWQVAVRGKSLALEGPLSTEAFIQIASIVRPPAPVEAAAAEPAPAPAGQKPPPKGETPRGAADAATASLEYYRAIDRMFQKLTKDIGAGSRSATLKQISGWLRRDSQRINRLPLLNVDPELAQWGGMVAARFGEAAAACSYGDQRTFQELQRVRAGFTGESWDDPYGDRGVVERINADRDRTAIIAEQKALTINEVSKVLQGLTASQAQIRQRMTERYKVPF